MNKKVFVIVGPTASGKSEIARLFFEKYGYELINADAYQIYKQMNIGTAKIPKEDITYSHYHLLDIKDVSEDYSVYNYQSDFRRALSKILASSSGAIIVGGTGLYIKASLFDFEFSKEESIVDMTRYNKLSNDDLYKELLKKDPKSLEKIHINNRKRLVRALAIADSGPLNKSAQIEKQKHILFYNDIDFEFIFINPNRNDLYKKINERVDEMINKGLENEVSNLFKEGNISSSAYQAIGYKEFYSYFKGEINYEYCLELIKKRTRNYAKRQITYFKHQLPCKEFTSIDEIKKEYGLY